MNAKDPRKQMERYRADELEGDEKRVFEQEVLADDRLSDELYDDVSLARSLEEAARRPARRMPRLAAVLIPVAAAALILFAIQLRQPESEAPPTMRGVSAGVELLSPEGLVNEIPDRFHWRRHPDARQYRFELFDLEARPVLQGVVTDTLWTPGPEQVVPPTGSWQVTPLDEFLMGIGETASAAYASDH